MNILKIDFRYRMIKEVFDALSKSLRSLEFEVQNSGVDFDSEFLVEQAEWVLGIAFVTAQTYITGTIVDANHITKDDVIVTKRQLMKEFSNPIDGTNLTQLQLCDAIANYFKHHEEWKDWSLTGHKKWTILSLAEVGIDRQSSFPCYQGASKLWPEENMVDLENLLEILSKWREEVVEALIKNNKTDQQ